MNEETKKITEEFESSLNKSFDKFIEEINKVRGIRINIESVRQINIPEISSRMSYIANIFSVQRQLVVEPFEKKNSGLIIKAVLESELGYKLEKSNAEKIYFSLMPLNQEIKNKIVNNYKQKTEEAKISARKTRQKILGFQLKSLKLSTDQEKKIKKQIDSITKKFENEMSNFCQKKTNDLVNF